ncbi:hypothetical protein Y032_0020g32 [Ancylostoma ceylanicum]|uniref:Uncharacterized protein n=1 Tax=Ancylostoma ceylanicum TaxID=53326 RepID=A0A016V153_9BILA|nr:hypothetical protein Y032_0020g32 [Ancylostoma ceylanicum]
MSPPQQRHHHRRASHVPDDGALHKTMRSRPQHRGLRVGSTTALMRYTYADDCFSKTVLSTSSPWGTPGSHLSSRVLCF